MEYKKITAEDIAGKGVVGQADTPLLSALEMQNKVEEVPRAVIIPHFNSLIDSLDKRDADVDTALSDRYTKTETDAAIARTVTEIGAGDMQKAVYDTDGDGVVDNAAKLGGKTPGQLTFGADQIITDEATDKRLPETLGEINTTAVNAYSLIGGIEIPANADLNNYVEQGNYCCSKNANVRTLVNCPAKSAFLLKVAAVADTGTWQYRFQELTAIIGSAEYRYLRRAESTDGGVTWTWENWQTPMPKSGGSFAGTAQARSDTRTITYSPGELVNTSVRDSSGNAVSTRFLIMIRK